MFKPFDVWYRDWSLKFIVHSNQIKASACMQFKFTYLHNFHWLQQRMNHLPVLLCINGLEFIGLKIFLFAFLALSSLLMTEIILFVLYFAFLYAYI